MILERIDPSTRLLALALLTTPLLISIDIVSASVSFALTLLVVAPLCGVGPARLFRRAWPLLLLAPLTGVSMLFYGRASGQSYFEWGFIHITENSVQLAIAVMIRVLAVGVPAVVFTADMDPTRLGDGLAQLWKLPTRFVIGAVAGVRLVTLFREDWTAVERARRARGLGDEGKLKRALQQSFSLLVLALRRGAKLATAMEARGFGATHNAEGQPIERTWARQAHFGGWDWAVVVGSLALSLFSLGIAVWTGHFVLLGVQNG